MKTAVSDETILREDPVAIEVFEITLPEGLEMINSLVCEEGASANTP